jgi:hypothetical protein
MGVADSHSDEPAGRHRLGRGAPLIFNARRWPRKKIVRGPSSFRDTNCRANSYFCFRFIPERCNGNKGGKSRVLRVKAQVSTWIR